jgi:hypothetical protein
MCKHEKKLGRFEPFGEVYHLCTNSNCGYLQLWSEFEKTMIEKELDFFGNKLSEVY